MLEFLFPWSMAAGAVLVSSPVIIHLINRMRFKRIRWAAMEFLLKSQKRSRRKLIIEQLILLALRILLVLLIGLIVARFLGIAFAFTPQNRHHVVILDDSPSMGDQWVDEGETKTSFKSAKKLISDEIAKNAVQASKSQQFKLITATKPEELVFSQRLSDATVRDLTGKLNTLEKESALHVDLIHSVRKARKIFEDTPQDQRILYIVSDFRLNDWSGANGKMLFDELAEMANLGINVKFVDVAHPTRKETEADARYHENLAIVSLQPESRVVGQDMPPTIFKVTVANYSPSDVKNVQVKVRLNGEDRAGSSVPIPVVPAGGQVDATFSLYLNDLGPNQISAYLDPEDSGLNVDNVRYTVVEVRKRVPVLLIDGDNTGREGGDRFFMEILFGTDQRKSNVASGYEVVTASLARLEEPDLDRFPSIYLCNIRELSDKALINLENYVRQGGNVAFFLGDRINAEFYNKKLYADGLGIFPAPLADRPSPEPTKEERDARLLQTLTDPQEQILVRKEHEKHSMLEEINREYRPFFMFLNIERYHPVARTKWNPQPGKVKELVTLPNNKSVEDYSAAVQSLLSRLPTDEKYKAYTPRLAEYRSYIRDLVAGKQPLYKLAEWLDKLLQDQGDPKQREKFPNLKEFWAQPEQLQLRTDLERMQQAVQYGDPFIIEGSYGKGRVVVVTSTLGRKWNNLSSLPVFVKLQVELQRYLTSVNKEAELIVGQPLDLFLDATRYDTKIRRFFKPEVLDQRGGKPDPKTAQRDMGEQQQVGTPTNGRIHFQFKDALEPGMYILEFYPGPSAKDFKGEQRAYAFNIDTSTESNLVRLRTSREDMEKTVPNSRFYNMGSDKFTDLAEKQNDLSESPWLYLLFLIVLILEQAMAVHLSFHLRGGAAAPITGQAQPLPGTV
ncbi:MAG: BatA domain-containing protein [Gemmataceae bacterium]|nr:BatA domain-containing protein [Gemmataceae bacterium]